MQDRHQNASYYNDDRPQEELEVDVELDTAPREVSVPRELRDALAKSPVAKRAFDKLSYSKKQRYMLPIERAKSPETKQRNVDKAIGELKKS